MTTECYEASIDEAVVEINEFTLTFICTDVREGLCNKLTLVSTFDHSKGVVMELIKAPDHIRAEAENLAFLKINEKRHEMQNSAP